MKSRIVSAVAVVAVIGSGAAAAAVNTQALWAGRSSDTIALTSDTQPAPQASAAPSVAEVDATPAAEPTTEPTPEAAPTHKARAHKRDRQSVSGYGNDNQVDNESQDSVEVESD